MFLKRIQVPDFRVLKDVDITFEQEFSPTIFPLGSLNGGGKSTLLQLIFVLLSCSGNPDKHILIQNMLEGINTSSQSNNNLININLHSENNIIQLNFIYCNDEYIYKVTSLEKNIRLFHFIDKFKNEISSLTSEIHFFEDSINKFMSFSEKNELLKRIDKNKEIVILAENKFRAISF